MRYKLTIDGVTLTASIIPNVRFGEINGTPVRVEKFRHEAYRWRVRSTGLRPELYGQGKTCTEALKAARGSLASKATGSASDPVSRAPSAVNPNGGIKRLGHKRQRVSRRAR